jgi:ABC-type sulfate transport system permease subunit
MDYSPILIVLLLSLFFVPAVGIFVWRLKTGKAHFNSFSADRATHPKEYWVIQALIAVPALGILGVAVWFVLHCPIFALKSGVCG